MEIVILLKVMFSLAVVLGLLFVFSHILKNYLTKMGYQGKGEDIKIRDLKFISRDKGLATFEFDSKIFLIAFDSSSISLLHKKDLGQGDDASAN